MKEKAYMLKFIKINNLLCRRVKRLVIDWEKIFAKYVSGKKELHLKHTKDSQKTNNKKTTLLKNGQRTQKDIPAKKIET